VPADVARLARERLSQHGAGALDDLIIGQKRFLSLKVRGLGFG